MHKIHKDEEIASREKSAAKISPPSRLYTYSKYAVRIALILAIASLGVICLGMYGELFKAGSNSKATDADDPKVSQIDQNEIPWEKFASGKWQFQGFEWQIAIRNGTKQELEARWNKIPTALVSPAESFPKSVADPSSHQLTSDNFIYDTVKEHLKFKEMRNGYSYYELLTAEAQIGAYVNEKVTPPKVALLRAMLVTDKTNSTLIEFEADRDNNNGHSPTTNEFVLKPSKIMPKLEWLRPIAVRNLDDQTRFAEIYQITVPQFDQLIRAWTQEGYSLNKSGPADEPNTLFIAEKGETRIRMWRLPESENRIFLLLIFENSGNL